jgi:predicted ATPase
MYLSRFGVKNYKCLADVDVPLTPIHVLIGQNDAGKTSLMEAMAAFGASTEAHLADSFMSPWTGAELVRHGHTPLEVELYGEWSVLDGEQDTQYSGIKYGYRVAFAQEGRNCTRVDEWIENGGQRRNLTQVGDGLTKLHRWKHGHVPNESPTADVNALVAILKSPHAYSFNAKLMAIPATSDLKRKFRLDSDGFGLATLLADIALYDPQSYQALRKEFCELFPQFRSVRVESESALQRHYQANGLHPSGTGVGSGLYFETHSGQRVRAQQASDGAVLVLGFLALAHVPDPPTLLLIEEPENGIYPKRLEQVISLLKGLVRGTRGVRFPQIIFSTHSPYVLSLFEPEEVTFLSRDPHDPQAGVRARPLRDAPSIKERLGGGEFYLGELWYNLSEEELFGDT